MLRRRKLWRILVVLSVVLMLLLGGCSKVKKENYDQLSLGMDYEEVVKILGAPDNCESKFKAKSCRWGDDAKHIALKFLADKLIFKSSKGLNAD